MKKRDIRRKMQNSKLENFFNKGFTFTFCLIFLMAGFGKISFKSYGIPLSFGGGLEKIIVWAVFFTLGSLGFKVFDFFRKNVKPLTLFFIFLTAVLISGLHESLGTKESREYLIQFIASSSVFFMTLYASEHPKVIRMAILCLIAGGIFTLIQGFSALYFDDFQSLSYLVGQSGAQRLSTPVGHPNFLGAFLMLLLPLSWIPSWTPLSKRQNLFIKILLTLFFLLGILFSYSRTAWIGTGFSLFMLIFLSLPVFQRSLLLILLIVCITGLFWFSHKIPENTSNPVLKRVESLANIQNEDNFIERIYAWKTTLKIIQSHLLTGIGAGNESFEKEYEKYLPLSAREILPHPHQIFLHLAAVFGLPVLFLYLTLLGYALFALLFNTASSSFFFWRVCLLSLLSSYLLYGLFDSPLFNERVSPLIWFALGLCFINDNPFAMENSPHADSL